MYANNLQQIYLFIIFLLNGFIIGILFDVFRILRKSFKTPDFITYIEDIIFWILTGLILLYSIFTFNNGEIRIYIFISILIGVIAYMLILSKYFIKINVYIISIIKNIITWIAKIILYPIRLINKLFTKILFKPIFFCFINLRKFSSKKLKKLLLISKNKTKKQKIQEN